jgi:hypothetical protein
MARAKNAPALGVKVHAIRYVAALLLLVEPL